MFHTEFVFLMRIKNPKFSYLMKTFTGIFALGIILLFASCQTEEKPNTLTKKEIKEGWELLFDGK